VTPLFDVAVVRSRPAADHYPDDHMVFNGIVLRDIDDVAIY
jgi:hypothetical protein